MPTESRSRSGGAGVPAPSTLARCSIRLSTPPSEVARFHSSHARRRRDRGRLAARSTRIDSMPPKPPLHLPRRDRVAVERRQPGIEHASTIRGCARSARRCAAPSAQAARTRRNSVRMPRSSSHASNEPSMRAELRAQRLARAAQNSSSRAVDQRAGEHVGMAVEVLGRRVHHEVGAERERPREHRRRRRSNRPRAARRRACASRRGRGDVGDVQSGFAGVSIQTSLRLAGPQRRAHARPGRSCRRTRPRGPSAWRSSRASCAATST